ncbi:MAG: hypothetical protein AAB657_01115 [Patescibacteria group bacterium]
MSTVKKLNSRNNAKSQIIVFVGEKLAGKEIAASFLIKKYKFTGFRFSKILTDLLQRLHLPITRVNEVALVGALRERFGGGVLAEVVKKEIIARGLKKVVIDGLRHPAEYEILKTMPGFKLVYLTAPIKLRYARAIKRGEKVGEKNFSFEEFKHEEKLPTEIFIKRLGAKAKVKIVNDGTVEQMYDKLVKVVGISK